MRALRGAGRGGAAGGGGYPPATLAELGAIQRAGAQLLGAPEAQREWESATRLDSAAAATLASGGRLQRDSTPLTTRQLEVACLVGGGSTNAEIAARLYLSERTVENHVLDSLRALGLHNRVQLATWVEAGARTASADR